MSDAKQDFFVAAQLAVANETTKKRDKPPMDLYLELQKEVRSAMQDIQRGDSCERQMIRVAAAAKLVSDASQRPGER